MVNVLLSKQTKIFLLFLGLHLSTAFQTLVDCEGDSISSKGFLPTVVDIRFVWIKFAYSCLLRSPAWPCSIYLDSWTQHSRLCNIVLCSIGLCFHSTPHPWHIHGWVAFLLWPSCFILIGAISNCPPLFPSSILNTFWPGGAGGSSSGIMSFCIFMLFMGVFRQ